MESVFVMEQIYPQEGGRIMGIDSNVKRVSITKHELQ